MSTLRPPAGSAMQRPTLLVMSGGLDAQGSNATADRLALETEALLEALEESIARLALAHRAGTSQLEDQAADDEAFAWVQQSIEDITATLRGLSLGRTTSDFAPADTARDTARDTALRNVGNQA